MSKYTGFVLLLVIVLVKATPTSLHMVYMAEVGDVMVRVLDQQLTDCHVVLLTTDIQSSPVSVIIR